MGSRRGRGVGIVGVWGTGVGEKSRGPAFCGSVGTAWRDYKTGAFNAVNTSRIAPSLFI